MVIYYSEFTISKNMVFFPSLFTVIRKSYGAMLPK